MASMIYTPENSCNTALDEGCGLGDFCPRVIDGCKNGCFDIEVCAENRIPLPLGCNPYTGEDMTTGDLTEIVLRLTHQDNGTVVDLVVSRTENPAYFDVVNITTYEIVLPPEATADLLGGVYNAEIFFTTADGTYKPYEFPVCSTKYTLADPMVIVTGENGAPNPFTIVGAKVTMWFHESDAVHVDRTWDRFVVNWGDGNEDTFDASSFQPPSNVTWTLQHVYAMTGNYEITVTGYLNTDNLDPCDPELSDCVTTNICVTV